MKLKKLAWQSVVKIQNRRFIRANTSLKTFSNRVEISFYSHNAEFAKQWFINTSQLL